MSITKLGIIVTAISKNNEPPILDQRLTDFLGRAQLRNDLELTIVCSRSLRDQLELLLTESNREYSILSSDPDLRLYNFYKSFCHKRRALLNRIKSLKRYIQILRSIQYRWYLYPLVAIKKILFVAGITLYIQTQKLNHKLKKADKKTSSSLPKLRFRKTLTQYIITHDFYLNQVVHLNEIRKMLRLVNSQSDIKAWYITMGYHPIFNKIKRPFLIDLPDLSPLNIIKHTQQYKRFKLPTMLSFHNASLRYFIAFSAQQHPLKEIKHLNKSLFIRPYEHRTLHQYTDVANVPDKDATSKALCQSILAMAFQKSDHREYISTYQWMSYDLYCVSATYIFCPNLKCNTNTIYRLLHAYKHLVREHFIPHKLILTHPSFLPEVTQFITEHHLDKDILCLPELTNTERAACYKLADITLNPCLLESDGFYTFTESLSVATPILMTNTPENLALLQHQPNMCFDPLNWEDIALRIEWAIHNRQTLLNMQTPLYEQFKNEDRKDKIQTYLDVLETISE